ncbi:hypothetical protein AAVH_40825, partial [Aphelenchoides avenae]
FEFGSYKKTRKMGVLLDTGNPGMELPEGLVRKISPAANAEYDWDTQLYLVDCNATFPDVVQYRRSDHRPVRATIRLDGKLMQKKLLLSSLTRAKKTNYSALKAEANATDWK